MTHRLSNVAALLLALAAAGCGTQAAVVTVEGDCADVFAGRVCTWATLEGSTLVEAGATIPIASIENAPAEVPMTWPPAPTASIPVPDTVREQAGFTQLTIDWEAGGHPPGAFMTPHFDFHFYAVSASDVASIDCTDESKPADLPAGYGLPDIPLPPDMASMIGVPTLVGLCVPKMGMHAVPESDIVRTDAFDGTMVIGYYAGRPIFVEPMISKAMLMRKASFELPMPDVPGLDGPRPTRFRADYDGATEAYRFSLSGFEPGA